jgi:hypothetical protein
MYSKTIWVAHIINFETWQQEIIIFHFFNLELEYKLLFRNVLAKILRPCL